MENIAAKQNQEFMKQQNIKLVLSVIKNRGPVSRAEISRIVNMSPTSIGRITEELAESGLIKEVGTTVNRVGRKASLLEVDSASVLAVGVEVDRNYIGAGIIDFSGKVMEKAEKTGGPSFQSPGAVAAGIEELVRGLLKNPKIDASRIVGVGAAFPGLVDREKGAMVLSAQLKWEKVPIRDILQEKIKDFPVTVDNEMKAKALAESFFGASQENGRVALMNIGSGVGSALLIHNKVYRGNSNDAGEIGHITIDPKGHLCECGRFGCLQTYIAEHALIEEAKKFKAVDTFDDLYLAYKSGEQWARNILSRAVEYIGAAIGTLVCLYNPDTVLLSGRLLGNYPEIAELVLETYQNFIWEPLRKTFVLKLAPAGEAAGITGAGALAFATGLDDYIL
jgi:predicted NBD/HSP70 family sugar kinase